VNRLLSHQDTIIIRLMQNEMLSYCLGFSYTGNEHMAEH